MADDQQQQHNAEMADVSALNELKAAPPKQIPRPEGNEGLTFGQQLVGLRFNPSGDNKVEMAKRYMAAAADLLHEDYNERGVYLPMANQLYYHAIGEILNAQMCIVKVLTLKY